MATVTKTSDPAPSFGTAHRVPASVNQILRLTKSQFKEYLSSRRFVILVGLTLVIGLILSFVLSYFHTSLEQPGGLLSDNYAFYGSIWGGAATFLAVLACVFFGGDAIAGEFQNKTGYFLMGLPIRRATVYIGKYIAALLASLAIIFLWLAICLANGIYYLGGNAFPWQLLPSLAIAIVYLMAVLGTTFMFSSLFKTSAYGFVLTAILFLFGFTIIQDLVVDLVKIQPWMVISYSSATVGEVFQNPSAVNWGLWGSVSTTTVPAGRGVTIQMTTWTPGVVEGVVIMLAYFILTAIGGLLLFEREEFT